MLSKVIAKLKKVKRLKTNAKRIIKAAKHLGSLPRRNPALMFHSPELTRRHAFRPVQPCPAVWEKLSNIPKHLDPHLAVYTNVLSISIRAGKEKYYAGGLVDGESFSLIDKAVHLGYKKTPTQEFPDPDKIDLSAMEEISQPVFYGGIMYNHFGHFLLESIGRLWAYQYVKELDPYIFFYLDSVCPDYLEKRNFINQVLTGFGIPLHKLLFLENNTRLKNVIVPDQKYGYEICKSPDQFFMDFIHTFRFPEKIPAEFMNAGKIYVSRAKVPLGTLVGEAFFEDFMRSQDYKIFYPESYNLYEQLAIYSRAEKIVFCDGAAIHACILLPGIKADLAVIARRRDPHYPCMEIIHQFYGYQKKVLWVDAVKEMYQFGLDSWYALAVIDWADVSKHLKGCNFINNLFPVADEGEIAAMVKKEIRAFTARINNRPEFTEFLSKSKEQLVVVNPASHVFDGQDLLPVTFNETDN